MLTVPKDRLRKILSLGLPIIGGMISQNVLNLVDSYFVGSLPNANAALAAVGQGSFTIFACQAVLMGVSTGVQAIAARRAGAGETGRTAISLNAGLIIVAAGGILLTIVFYLFSAGIMGLQNNNADVLAESVPYFKIRVLTITFLGFNFAFRGYWNAIQRPGLYLFTIVIMHTINALLDAVLVPGRLGFPQMGVYGAGLASSIALVCGSLIYFFLGLKHATGGGFLKIMPSREDFKSILKLSIPNSLQQLLFALGFTILFIIISKIGTRELAAAQILIQIMLTAILPAIGLGLAAASLSGQAMGREDIEDAARWGWDVAKVGFYALTAAGLVMLVFPAGLLAPFLKDPQTLLTAKEPLQLFGAFMGIEAVGLIIMNALLGVGYAKWVMVVAVSTQWFLFLPIAYYIGPRLGYGLLAVWIAQAGYRGLQTSAFIVMWVKRGWTSVKL